MKGITKVSGGMSSKLLWTNPSPTSAFGYQNIVLNDSRKNYDYLCFEWFYHTSAPTPVYTTIINSYTMENSSSTITTPVIGGAYTGYNGSVMLRWVSTNNNGAVSGTKLPDNSIFISNCIGYGNSNLDNAVCIPIKIYGVKGKISGI